MNEVENTTDTDIEQDTPDGSDPEPGSEPAGDDLETLRRQLTEAEQKLDAATEELMRARADLDNFRKRSAREVESARKYALDRFMADLLEVRDSLERGLEAADSDQVSIEQLKEGKALTYRMLDKVMTQHGLVEVDPLGEKFDPERHEALSMVPTDEHEPDTVVTVVQKGYLLNDRLVRPARVIVSRPAV